MKTLKRSGLNAKQLTFANEYLANGFNALHAYLKVYGGKPTAAQVSASRMLSNIKVNKYIEDHIEEYVTTGFITKELSKDVREGSGRQRSYALNLLGKYKKMFSENTTNVNLNQFEHITYDEEDEISQGLPEDVEKVSNSLGN